MLIDEINYCPEKNRESFTTTGWCIYQTAFAVDDMLPGLLLKYKRVIAFLSKPFFYNYIAGCGIEFQIVCSACLFVDGKFITLLEMEKFGELNRRDGEVER